MLNLISVPTQAVPTLGPSCLEQVSSWQTVLPILEQITSSRITFLSLDLKYYIFQSFSLYIPLLTFIFFMTLKAIWSVVVFNICPLVSMLPSPIEKQVHENRHFASIVHIVPSMCSNKWIKRNRKKSNNLSVNLNWKILSESLSYYPEVLCVCIILVLITY